MADRKGGRSRCEKSRCDSVDGGEARKPGGHAVISAVFSWDVLLVLWKPIAAAEKVKALETIQTGGFVVSRVDGEATLFGMCMAGPESIRLMQTDIEACTDERR